MLPSYGIVGDEEIARQDAVLVCAERRTARRTASRPDGTAGTCPARSADRRPGTARSKSRAPLSPRTSALSGRRSAPSRPRSATSAFLISSSANGSRERDATSEASIASVRFDDDGHGAHSSSISMVSQVLSRARPSGGTTVVLSNSSISSGSVSPFGAHLAADAHRRFDRTGLPGPK